MNIKPGMTIRSTDPADPVFGDAAVLITGFNANGATGFVVDKPFGRALNDLQEFRHLPAFPLYWGGRVDEAHLFFLHRRPDIIPGGTEVTPGLYLGGDFAAVTASLALGQIDANGLRIFVGYCGWDAGDLERELADDGWREAFAPVWTNE